jgi:hypothetical protein
MPMLGSVIWYGWPLPSALEVPFGAISAYERSVSAFPLSSDSTGCFSMSVTEPATSYQARTDIGSSFPIFSTDAADPIPEAGKGNFLFCLLRMKALFAPFQQTAPRPRPTGQSTPPSLLIFGKGCRILGRAHGR